MQEKERAREVLSKASFWSRLKGQLFRTLSPEFRLEKEFKRYLKPDVDIKPIIDQMRTGQYVGAEYKNRGKPESYAVLALTIEQWWEYLTEDFENSEYFAEKVKPLSYQETPITSCAILRMVTLEKLNHAVDGYIATEKAKALAETIAQFKTVDGDLTEVLLSPLQKPTTSTLSILSMELKAGLGTATDTTFAFFELLPKLLKRKKIPVTRKALRALAENSYGSVVSRLSSLKMALMVRTSKVLAGDYDNLETFSFSPDLFYIQEDSSGYRVKMNHIKLFIALFFSDDLFWRETKMRTIWCPASFALSKPKQEKEGREDERKRKKTKGKDVIKSLFEWCLDEVERTVWAQYPEE